MKRLVLALVVLGVASSASAQPQPPGTVMNPTRVEFTPSVDHDRVVRYELEVRDAVGATALVLDLGLPDVVDNTAGAPFDSALLPFGVYTAVARAVALDAATGLEVSGPDSDPSNTFVRVPGAPGLVLVVP